MCTYIHVCLHTCVLTSLHPYFAHQLTYLLTYLFAYFRTSTHTLSLRPIHTLDVQTTGVWECDTYSLKSYSKPKQWSWPTQSSSPNVVCVTNCSTRRSRRSSCVGKWNKNKRHRVLYQPLVGSHTSRAVCMAKFVYINNSRVLFIIFTCID
jgi:hypothetical protein